MFLFSENGGRAKIHSFIIEDWNFLRLIIIAVCNEDLIYWPQKMFYYNDISKIIIHHDAIKVISLKRLRRLLNKNLYHVATSILLRLISRA